MRARKPTIAHVAPGFADIESLAEAALAAAQTRRDKAKEEDKASARELYCAALCAASTGSTSLMPV